MKYSSLGATALVVTVAFASSVSAEGRGSQMDFSDLDVSGDGVITAEDFQARQAERFSAMDADGDGSVNAEEFTASAAERASERAGEMFERLDVDGDGLLSQDALQSRGGRGIERMIRRFDEDGDGGLSEAEFDTAKAQMRDRAGRRGEGRR